MTTDEITKDIKYIKEICVYSQLYELSTRFSELEKKFNNKEDWQSYLNEIIRSINGYNIPSDIIQEVMSLLNNLTKQSIRKSRIGNILGLDED
jgi:hypothetical protein